MQTVHKNTPENALVVKRLYRDRIELLRSRVSLLNGKDRLLMTMYLENGNTFRQLARLAGVSEGNIARRIHKLTKRLMDGEYIRCLRHRDKLTRTELKIARDYFLLGLSHRKIALKHNCNAYKVRKTLERIQLLVETTDSV
ncbi:MAG: helix-turn-helix domain-containing protein [Planctomycetota bacterium]|jgi:DNA-directed RNA polymerase specialized sigma24 family protein